MIRSLVRIQQGLPMSEASNHEKREKQMRDAAR